MKKESKKFQKLEKYMTIVLLCSLFVFLFYLFAAGYGINWFKIICAIISILIPLLCFLYLYLVREWRKKRSQWMIAASVALFSCTMISLLLSFPSPAP